MTPPATAVTTPGYNTAGRKPVLLGLGPQEVWPASDGGREGIHGAIAALAQHFDLTYACPAGESAHQHAGHYADLGIRFVPVPFEPTESISNLLSATVQLKPFKFHKYSNAAAIRAFSEALGPLRPDVIVCFHAHTEALGRGLTRLRGWQVPVVLREHNIEYELLESYCQSMPALQRWVASPFIWMTRRTERQAWSRCGSTAFLSDRDLATAEATGVQGRMILAPEGVPIPPARPFQFPAGPAQLLLPFNPKAPQSLKNSLDFLHRYWKVVADAPELRTVRLAVTGVDASRLAELSSLSVPEQTRLRIHALGFLPSLAPAFEGSLAVLAPTFFGGGIRKKILEAMANQVPVIATDLDIQTCHYFDAGVNILRMGGPLEFIAQVTSLLNNPQRWVELAQAARETVERHASWENFAQVLQQEIMGLLQSSSAQAPSV